MKMKIERFATMSVERRYSARHPIDLNVHVRYRKRRFYCAHAHDLSTDGMYLKVRNVTLPSGTLVELEFELEGKAWLVPAIVVHHHDAGVGVMFRDPQPALFDHLIHRRSSTLPPRQGEVARDQAVQH
jgi:hypothetical protein